MALNDLLASLRTDLGDEDQRLFTDVTLTRCLHKAVFRLASDLRIALSIVEGEIEPTPDGVQSELLLLLGQIHACQIMRSATANAFSFSSGDKRVDKTRQPEHWAKLEADLWGQYKGRIAELKPEAALQEDAYFLTPNNISPVIFEQGGRRRCHY